MGKTKKIGATMRFSEEIYWKIKARAVAKRMTLTEYVQYAVEQEMATDVTN